MSHIQVVSAFIVRNGRVLLQQRTPKGDFPFTWECPGGKVEVFDKSLRLALHRELQEEIGWNGYIVERPFFEARVEPPDAKASLSVSFFSCCDDPAGFREWNPKLKDAGIGIGWFPVSSMCALSLTPGNRLLFNWLLENGMPRD